MYYYYNTIYIVPKYNITIYYCNNVPTPFVKFIFYIMKIYDSFLNPSRKYVFQLGPREFINKLVFVGAEIELF